jgi:hypothetical protein
MAPRAEFTITSYEAPRLAVDASVGRIARQLAALAADNSPRDTGTLAAGYQAVHEGLGVWKVINDVEYWRFVEFGTAEHGAAQPAMGRALAEMRARYGSAF